MRIAVPRETDAGEPRVAASPETVKKLKSFGAEVAVARGAGIASGIPDSEFEAAGAQIADIVTKDADIVLKVRRPAPNELTSYRKGALVIAIMDPYGNEAALKQIADAGLAAFAMELMPRITRAQSMDVLSSQSTVAGYKAVLIGAAALPKFLPMLTTAAGNVSPAKVFIIGAGVAGLQAIATARRLGGVVSAFDVRPAAREQVLSLGATFVANDLVAAGAETSGGYARAQSEDEAARTRSALANHVKDVDLVVTTAQIPGKPAPRLITADMVASMRPGAVIVDLAAESGGNCELTLAGETVQSGPATIIGPVNVPATVPFHASQMFGKNVLALVTHLSTKEGALSIDPTDEITGAMTVVRDGSVVART